MNDSIAIIGSGALGCLFACKLAAAGYAPVMLTDWQPAIEAIEKNGVRVRNENDQEISARIEVVSDPKKVKPCGIALVLVKSWQTAAVADQVKEFLTEDGVAFTLQNGLGNLEVLSTELGDHRAAAGICTLGSQVLSPGYVKQSGTGNVTLGNFNHAQALKIILNRSNIPTAIEENISGLLWQKAIANAAINPLTAILSIPNGDLLSNSWAIKLMRKLIREAEEIASLAGVTLPESNMTEYVLEIIRSTHGNISSMLQDLRNGRETEIDSINGMFVKFGAELGYSASYNQAIMLVVKSLVNSKKTEDFNGNSPKQY